MESTHRVFFLALLAAFSLALLGGCGDDAAAGHSADTREDVTETFAGSQLLHLSGCRGFFGAPGESTGVKEGLCGPACECDDGRFAPVYDDAFVANLRSWTLLHPPPELEDDPYADPDRYPRRDDAVCAVIVEDRIEKTYRLETFDDMGAMTEAGGILTHTSACGVCSSLATLALLIEMPDQTGPIRDCGLQGLTGDLERVVTCLEGEGFERPCAQLNAYNTQHTRNECGAICFPLLNAPYQSPDGALNDCIQCDEDLSGDIFRAVAGRARRNAGIAAALCRPCEDMVHILHQYE